MGKSSPYKRGTKIVEFDPFTCSIVSSYTYKQEGMPSWVKEKYGEEIGVKSVAVCNGRIYALLSQTDYPGRENDIASAVSGAFRAADSKGVCEDPYFVEISTQGTITREIPDSEIPELKPLSEFGGESISLHMVDGKIYMFYLRFKTNSRVNILQPDYVNDYNNGVYCFDGEVNAASAKKIVFPDGVIIGELMNTNMMNICSDGNGGIYFAAFKHSGRTDSNDRAVADGTAIFHYDGSSISEVYSEGLNGMIYDKVSSTIFGLQFYDTGERAFTNEDFDNVPDEVKKEIMQNMPDFMNMTRIAGKLVALRLVWKVSSSSGDQ